MKNPGTVRSTDSFVTFVMYTFYDIPNQYFIVSLLDLLEKYVLYIKIVKNS